MDKNEAMVYEVAKACVDAVYAETQGKKRLINYSPETLILVYERLDRMQRESLKDKEAEHERL